MKVVYKKMFKSSPKALLMMACLCAPGFVSSVHAEAGSSPQGYGVNVEIAYSEGNPDYSYFANGEGYTVLASYALSEHVYLQGHANEVEFKPGGPINGSRVQKNWRSVGAEYKHPVAENLNVTAEANYERQEFSDDAVTGYSIGSGIELKLLPAVDFNVRLNYMNIELDDWQLTGELFFYLNKNVYCSLRIRDYDENDFTYYEGGVGVFF